MNLDLSRLLLDLKLLLNPLRLLFFSFFRILVLTNLANETWIKSSKRFFISQKVDLETNSRPKPQRSTTVGFTYIATTFANNVRIILPLVKLPSQIKFYLQLFFYEIESISTGNNTGRS